jgi:DNA-binding SARP family transcriptional activator
MLQLRVLGEQRVEVDGRNVTADVPNRTFGLLAQFALHSGEYVARAGLAAAFWPDSTDEQALTNLRRELHTLRRLLPAFAQQLEADARSLRWNPAQGIDCDVATFRAASALARHLSDDDPELIDAAAAAVRGYGGELLPAWLDDWVVSERERLHRECLDLLDLLTTANRKRGELGDALAFARRRVELEPLEETGYRTLMQLQLDVGDRGAAIGTFHRCVATLDRQLGVTPDPSTVALYESMAGSNAAPARSATSPVSRIPLVGRDETVERLMHRWDEARRGRCGLHVVVGEAGVGKTRVVMEVLARSSRQGDVCARARCFAGGGRLALAPIAEWLSARQLNVHLDALPPTWQAEVERLVPRPDADPQPAPQPMVDAWQRHRFLEGLVHAVLASGRPTLLVLDDLQWCDAETLAWLHLLLRRAHGRPLLVLATLRAEEMADNGELMALLRALAQEGRLTRTDLAPLAAASAAELARRLGMTVTDEESLHRLTRGYPLFVIESTRIEADSGAAGVATLAKSSRVQAVLEGRLSHLDDDSAAVAKVAAVIGRDFTPDLLIEACDLPAEPVLSALDELWRRRLVVSHRSGRYDFAHDLLRDAVLRQLSPPRAALLHRRVAQAIELLAGDEIDPLAAELADHYEVAGVATRAQRFHVVAAEFATQRFANDAAIRHYESAIRLLGVEPPSPERDRRELALWTSVAPPLNAQYGFASTRLESALTRALTLTARLGDERTELLALSGLFSVYVVQGRLHDSYEIAQRSLRRSERYPEVAGQAHFAMAGALTMLGRIDEALPHYDVVPGMTMGGMAAIVGTRPEVHSEAWHAHALWLAGRRDEAWRRVTWACDRARELDHPFSLAVGMAYATMLAQFDEDRPQVREYGAQTEQLCRMYDFTYYGAWARVLLGWAEGGSAGFSTLSAALDDLDTLGAQLRRSYYLTLASDLALESGERSRAERLLSEADAAAGRWGEIWYRPQIWFRQAALLPAGEQAQAVDAAERLANDLGCRAFTDRTLTERRPS